MAVGSFPQAPNVSTISFIIIKIIIKNNYFNNNFYNYKTHNLNPLLTTMDG